MAKFDELLKKEQEENMIWVAQRALQTTVTSKMSLKELGEILTSDTLKPYVGKLKLGDILNGSSPSKGQKKTTKGKKVAATRKTGGKRIRLSVDELQELADAILKQIKGGKETKAGVLGGLSGKTKTLATSRWNDLITTLKHTGKVKQSGEKASTTYEAK